VIGFHPAAPHLVGEPVAFEDDRVVVVQWLDEVHVVPQACDEVLERQDRLREHPQPASHLTRSQPGLQGRFLGLEIAHQRAEPGFAAIRHPVHIEARGIGVVQDVQQDVDLTVHGIGQVSV
jgi:hypothetical protein